MSSKQAKQENGKGGSFDTRRNPFARDRRMASYPEPSTVTLLLGAIDLLLRAECAIIIGTTRDGGALCLTVLDGEDRHRTYCSTQVELEDACKALVEMYT